MLSTPVRRLDAAMLSVQHSFLVQNWRVGDKLSTPRRDQQAAGARLDLAEVPRPGRRGGGAGSGYLKAYIYDKRLLNAPPPYFLRPQTTPYNVLRVTD